MAINFLSNIEFRFNIKRLPTVEFYIQEVTMPGINSGFAQHATPFKILPRTGDKMEFEDLILRCAVDEKMVSYTEVWNWLVSITNPTSFDQRAALEASDDGIVSDATLMILNSSKNPAIEVDFINLFPISVSSIQFDLKQTEQVPPVVDFTFKYDSYTFRDR